MGATADGGLDLADLERRLIAHRHRRLVIGSFSAASNVTGVITDTDRVSALLHAHGAIACWDYAAGGPYLPIRMAASAPGRRDHKDAVFLSPHKFLGGPQTPGVLIVHRGLIPATPTLPGGGTVTFVGPTSRLYVPDPVMREESGTPPIVESIRAGLAFLLKERVGTAVIHDRHERLNRRVLDRWRADPRIEILGPVDQPRLPIFSVRLRHGPRYLHHNFVVAVLSDLFGIQVRGGCSCAGPYGHRLLGIGEDESAALSAECARGMLGVKPGWTRVSMPYLVSDDEADYVAGAVELVARYGHRLLTDYAFHPTTGLWRHRRAWTVPPSLRDLGRPASTGRCASRA